MCPHSRAPRGSRSRLTAIAATRIAVPNSSRPRVTWKGAYPSVPTLINRKLKPQISDRAAKRSRQSIRARGPAGAGDWDRVREDAVTVLMASTMLEATS